MTKSLDGEATPLKNTAPINPLTFDNEALAKLLQPILDSKRTEPLPEPPPEEAEAEPEATEAQPEGVEETESDVPEEEQPEETETEPDDANRGVQKRIDKLTAQKKEAQEKADGL